MDGNGNPTLRFFTEVTITEVDFPEIDSLQPWFTSNSAMVSPQAGPDPTTPTPDPSTPAPTSAGPTSAGPGPTQPGPPPSNSSRLPVTGASDALMMASLAAAFVALGGVALGRRRRAMRR